MSIAGERHLLAQGQDAAQTTTVDVLTTLDAPFDVETPYEFDI